MPDGEGQVAKSFQLVKDYSAAFHERERHIATSNPNLKNTEWIFT